MKKLLLLFLTSFTFISSANADSIDGAFGYKLGQVVNDVIITSYGDDFIAEKKFKPNKPLLGLNNYQVKTTLQDKVVYEISAYVSEKATNSDKCSSDSGDYTKILKALKNKYKNQFHLPLRDTIYHCTNSFCRSDRWDMFGNLNETSIDLECTWYVDKKYPEASRYSMFLKYTDGELKEKYNRENKFLTEKKIQGQLQDVDF